MRIEAVACKTAEGVVHSLPRPARHHNVIHQTGIAFLPKQQGFVTECGKWVDRVEALKIAEEAGQLINGVAQVPPNLYSEDVW